MDAFGTSEENGPIELRRNVGNNSDFEVLLDNLYGGNLLSRNKSMTILASRFGLTIQSICDFLGICYNRYYEHTKKFNQGGADALFGRKIKPKKSDDESIKTAVFALLHEPPSKHGIN